MLHKLIYKGNRFHRNVYRKIHYPSLALRREGIQKVYLRIHELGSLSAFYRIGDQEHESILTDSEPSDREYF